MLHNAVGHHRQSPTITTTTTTLTTTTTTAAAEAAVAAVTAAAVAAAATLTHDHDHDGGRNSRTQAILQSKTLHPRVPMESLRRAPFAPV